MARLAMLCGVFAMFPLLGGCPDITPDVPCETDADCDDGDFCNGAETCADDGFCADGEAPCGENETCDEDTDACLCDNDDGCDDGNACTDDVCTDGACSNDAVDCDDGDACTTDTCDPADGMCDNTPIDCNDNNPCTADACAAGVCSNTEVDCPDDQVCDPATGMCVDLCEGVTCDDMDACTDDSCDPMTGDCVFTEMDCNDGDPCTDDACADGVCGSTPVSCPAGQTCDPDTGECVSVPCMDDTECDDGLFCNGTETCGDDGNCAAGANPCDEGETCNENLNTCVVPMGPTITLTLGTDMSPATDGTEGEDTYNAPLLFNAPTGTNVPSLQTGDSANGGDGNDMLSAQFNFGAVTVVAPTLTSIETVNLTDFGTAATTLAGGGITGATDFNIFNSTNTNVLTINNLPTLADLSLMNQAIGATVVFQTAATSGSMDSMTLGVNGLTGAGTTVTITTGTTNGVETLTVDSTGSASSFSDIAMNGTTLTTVNVSGSANLEITTTLDANVTTVNASGATGNVSLTQTNAGNLTFTGGAGNDTILLAGTYGATDTLNGGGGNDTLGANTGQLGGTTGNQTNVTNFEALRVADAHTTALNVSHFGSINTVTLDVGSNGGSITNASTGLALNAGVRAMDPAGAGTLAVTVAGSATTDSVTYTLNDCDQTGAVTFTGVETLNLVSNVDLDGSAAAGGTAGVNTLGAALILTDTAAVERVVITGNESLTITGAITANEITASGFNEPFIMGAQTTSVGVTVTGGGGNDTLFASAGNDIINAGAGNDIINHMAGNDLVTGGAGADVLRQASAAANGADRQTVTDFDDTPTSGDVFNLNTGLATLTGTDNFATSSSIHTHSTAGNLTVPATAEVVRVTSGTVTDFTSANSLNGTNLLTAIGGTITGAIMGQNNILIAVADTSGNVGVYYASSADNAIIAGEITLVAILQGANVTLANLVFNNFTNGA